MSDVRSVGSQAPVASGEDAYRSFWLNRNGYVGIMSYCTAKHLWFSEDDKRMLMKAYPLKRRIRVPFISRG